MENQNQHYGTHESMYVEDPNEQKAFLHSEEGKKTEVTGDPTETAEDRDLNPDARATGIADVDGLLEEVNDKQAGNSNDPGDEEDDDDDDDDDLGLDDDDNLGLDDEDSLPVEPDGDGDDLDEDDLDDDVDSDDDLDDDIIDNDLNTDDKDTEIDEDDEIYFK